MTFTKWMFGAIYLFVISFGSTDCYDNDSSRELTGFCSTISSYTEPHLETYVDTYQILINKPCGMFGIRTCSSKRISYRIGHRTTYRTAYQISYSCCDGWKAVGEVCKQYLQKPKRLRRDGDGGSSHDSTTTQSSGKYLTTTEIGTLTNTTYHTSTSPVTPTDVCASKPCSNGACVDDGVNGFECKCKKGYSGETCDIAPSPSCSTEKNATVTWPETSPGMVAESTQRCPIGTDGRSNNMPLVTRLCNDTISKWEPPEFTDCGEQEDLTIDDIREISVDEDSVKDVADALVNITGTQQEMDIDIEDISKIIGDIVSIESSSPEVTGAVIEAVNNILVADVSQSNNLANASSVILRAVEEQIARTLQESGHFKSVHPNIAVEGITLNGSSLGVGFAIQQIGSAIANADISTGIMDSDSRSFIQLPKDALGNTNDTKVSFIGYNDDKLFKSNITQNHAILTPIISAVILGKKVTNLDENVVVNVIPSIKNTKITMNNTKCVYWDFDLRDGIGDWAQHGCELVGADSGKVTCQCNHLTNFAVLVDFAGQSEPGTLTFALDLISQIGCILSITALGLTLIIFILSSRLRISLQRKILIQFCISMLCLYLAFLIGIDISTDAGCTAATVLLHYFVLTTVFWMGVEARHMYITLVSEYGRTGRKFMVKAGLFAWGVPLIPVGVVLGLKWKSYHADEYCFIAPDYGLYFGLLLPVGLVILHNVITFLLVSKQLLSTKSYIMKDDLEGTGEVDSSDVKEIAQRLLNAFSVSMILGITWVFGFLAIDEVRFAFQLIFCICNSFQGVMIFFLFCIAQKDVRRLIAQKCCSGNKSPSKAKLVQQKQPVNNAAKGAPAWSISDSTRVSGESYSIDGDTMVTKLDDDTMAMSTLESKN